MTQVKFICAYIVYLCNRTKGNASLKIIYNESTLVPCMRKISLSCFQRLPELECKTQLQKTLYYMNTGHKIIKQQVIWKFLVYKVAPILCKLLMKIQILWSNPALKPRNWMNKQPAKMSSIVQ